jgi:hypothetical protein
LRSFGAIVAQHGEIGLKCLGRAMASTEQLTSKEKQRLAAVEDLLNNCRDMRHELNKAHSLAPVLLGRAWQSEEDDYALEEAMRTLLEAELQDWRVKLQVQPPTQAPLSFSMEMLGEDILIGNDNLIRRSLAWAYYIEGIETEGLVDICKRYKRPIQARRIQGLIREWRIELAKFIVRHEASSILPIQFGNQEQVTKASVPPDTAAKAHPEPQTLQNSPDAPASPFNSHRPATRGAEHHIYGNSGQVINAPVHGSVRQVQNIHQSVTTSSGKDASNAENPLPWLIVLLLFVTTYWLLNTVPMIGMSTLLLFSLWRTGVHGWRCISDLSLYFGTQRAWWQICYSTLWLGILGWAISTTIQVGTATTWPDYSLGGLAVIWSFFATSAIAVLLGILDIFFWVYLGGIRLPRILRFLEAYAKGAWEHRWAILAAAWLAFVGFCISVFSLVGVGAI